MTLIIPEPPSISDHQLEPTTVLRSQAVPTYCGICSAPCLTPRLPTPQPEESDPPLTKLADSLSTPAWLHQYHHLQPSAGILPFPLPKTDPRDAKNPHKRIVPIHLYCLRAVLGVVKSGMFNCGSLHEERMMIGYSIPRYVGFGPWMPASLRFTERPESTWMGMADQRSRWDVIEGTHLLPVGSPSSGTHMTDIQSDLQCPLTLDDPKDYALPSYISPHRKALSSPIKALPSHIITNIALLVIQDGEKQPINPAQNLQDLLSLCRTSQSFRQLHLSGSTWARLVICAVDRYRDDLVQRWRANPSGTGGVGQLWIALEEAFMVPIKEALLSAKRGAQRTMDRSIWAEEEEAVGGLRARDVLYWWLYSDAWRSRRRVWHCAVHASATARDSDWW